MTNFSPSPLISTVCAPLHRQSDQLRRGLEHYRRQHVGAVDRLNQRVLDALVARGRIGDHVDEGFRAAISVLAVVVEHRLAQGAVSHFLILAAQRRGDIQAARIRLVAKHLVNEKTRKFGRVLGVQAHPRRLVGECAAVTRLEFLRERGIECRPIDVAEVQHSRQHVLLPALGALRIHERVVGARGHRQSGKRGHFGDRHILQLLAESRSARPPQNRRRADRGRSGWHRPRRSGPC